MSQKFMRKSRLTRAIETSSASFAMMPPKYHKRPGKDFDIYDSELIDFICRVPRIRQLLYDAVTEKAPIVYDPETHQWCGKLTMAKRLIR